MTKTEDIEAMEKKISNKKKEIDDIKQIPGFSIEKHFDLIVSLNNQLAELQREKNLLTHQIDEDLINFLWKESQVVPSLLSPKNMFGQYAMRRDRVVKKVKEAIAAQLAMDPGESQSVYLSGCRGSGKTSLQMLLARSFKADGYEVFFFADANYIPIGIGRSFKTLLEDKTKKVAVLIDEVANNPTSGLYTALLKGPYPHLVTIGSIHSGRQCIVQVKAEYERSGVESG